MKRIRGFLVTALAVVALSFSFDATLLTQQKTPDYSGEPFVIEQWHEHARFETDGRGRYERTVRVRIQQDEGVRAWGQLVAAYNASNETMDPPEVSIRKADGAIVTVDTKAAQDIALPVEIAAPTYTGYRQRHVSVPSLRPGDVLTWRVTRTIVTPLVPGHFWLDEDFIDDAVVLDARVTLDLPADRRVTLKVRPGVEELTGAEAPPAAAGRRVRAWRSSNLTTSAERQAKTAAKDAEEPAGDEDDDTPEPPAVRMSSFQGWEEIGRWYAGLVTAASEPDAAIRAKAEALTKDRATAEEKLRALYDFVSRDVRYVSLSLGLNQYQPHKASDTLRDLYGDCKDKHTLFAALARAAGLGVDPVLIHSSRPLDESVPSPSQFDHVISVATAAGGAEASAWTWLDTTPGVAPYRALMGPLRGKTALRAVADRPALVVVPKRPVIELGIESEIEGRLDDQGKLDMRATYVARGDMDLFWRSMLSNVPKAQWPSVGEGLQKSSWIGGTLSEFTAADPRATDEPFRVSYRVERTNYIDRQKAEFGMYVPLDRRQLSYARESDWKGRTKPRQVGGPSTVRFRARIELPATFRATLPSNVDLVRPYGRYTATYALDKQTLIAERTLSLGVDEIPVSQAQDYVAFARAIHADYSQTVRLTMPPPAAAPTTAAPTTDASASTSASTSASANLAALSRTAYQAIEQRRYADAVALYDKVLAADPKADRNNRGRALFELGRLDEAAADLEKQVAANPFDPYAYNNLGRVYWRQRKFDQATAVFNKQIEINPLDEFAHRNLGQMELERKRYAEALPSLEKASGIKPEDAFLRVSLGTAYLETKALDKARASFDKAVELAPNPTIWNNVAYQMSLRDFDLDRAVQYSESAIGSLTIAMRLIALDSLKAQNLAGVATFSVYWDTLGWIQFRRGDLAQAEKYLAAAWQLDPRAEIGRHVGALREKQGRPRDAMRAYAEALVLDHRDADARAKLEALAKAHPADAKALSGGFTAAGRTSTDFIVDNCRNDLVLRRTVKLDTAGLAGPLPAVGTVADVFLLFDSASPAIALKFVKPQPAFALLEPALKGAKYPVSWPTDAPTKLVRRAIVGCDAAKVCTAVLIPPDNTRSVD